MLAIVIPYFKIYYLKETLDSLLLQTNKNFNIYVGDDASPDNPQMLLKTYEDKLVINYTRFENNLGLTALPKQWDRCLNLVQKEQWIMILGDDDFISSNYIEKFYFHLPEIMTLDVNVIRFASREVDLNGNWSKLYTHPKIEKSTDFFFRKFFKNSRSSLSEHIFKRDVYNKIGFRPLSLGWGTDDLAWLEFTNFGYAYTINSALVYFRISDKNISRPGFLEDTKAQTKFQFFEIIIENYLSNFERSQRLKLLLYYEKLVYSLKLINFSFFTSILYKYLKERELKEAVKFLRRVFLNLYR